MTEDEKIRLRSIGTEFVFPNGTIVYRVINHVKVVTDEALHEEVKAVREI